MYTYNNCQKPVLPHAFQMVKFQKKMEEGHTMVAFCQALLIDKLSPRPSHPSSNGLESLDGKAWTSLPFSCFWNSDAVYLLEGPSRQRHTSPDSLERSRGANTTIGLIPRAPYPLFLLRSVNDATIERIQVTGVGGRCLKVS